MQIIAPVILSMFLACAVYIELLRHAETKHLLSNRALSILSLFTINTLFSVRVITHYGIQLYSFTLMILINVVLIVALRDYFTKAIQDAYILLLLVIGVLNLFFIPEIKFYDPMITAILVGLAGLISMRLVKDGIGLGDIKLLSCVALVIGYQGFFQIFFISLLLGLIYGVYLTLSKKADIKTQIPFAPFIFISLLIVVITKI